MPGVVLGVVAGINLLAAKWPARWDLTAQKRYSLSDQTVKVLGALDKPVELVAAVHRGTDTGDLLESIAREYRRRSPKVKVEIVDFARSKNVAKGYGIDTPDTILARSGDKSRRAEGYNIFSSTIEGLEFKGEQVLTRAVLEVTGRAGKKVYFPEGYGEPALAGEQGGLRSLVEGEGYTAEPLNLAIKGRVPADAAVVVVMGPETDLDAKEAGAPSDYRKKGGKLFLLLDPLPGRRLPLFSRLSGEVGVEPGEDLVVDPVRGFFMDATSPVPELGYHDITAPLRRNGLKSSSREAVRSPQRGRRRTWTSRRFYRRAPRPGESATPPAAVVAPRVRGRLQSASAGSAPRGRVQRGGTAAGAAVLPAAWCQRDECRGSGM